MPQAAGIVGHGIDGPRNVVMPRHITMLALVKGTESEQVGAGQGTGRGAFVGPR